MELLKYCKREHNISEGCSTLHVGTLLDYHETDNQEINDNGEGLLRLHYDVPEGSVVTKAWVAAVTQFIGFDDTPVPRFGSTGGYQHELSFDPAEGDFVRIKKMSGFVNLVSPNRYIFCSSLQSHKQFTEYNSFYKIDEKNISLFAKTTADLIWSQLKLKNIDIGSSGLDFSHINNGFSVQPTMKKVTYLDFGRNFLIDSEEKFPLRWLIDTQNEMAFVKPSKFKDECEFRICFDVFTKYGHKVDINKGFIDLELIAVKYLVGA